MKPERANFVLGRIFDRVGEANPTLLYFRIYELTRGGFPSGPSSGRRGDPPLPLPDRYDQEFHRVAVEYEKLLIVAVRALDQAVQLQRSVVQIYAGKPDNPLNPCARPGCPNKTERGSKKHLVNCDRCRQWLYRHKTEWTPQERVRA